jgi:PAS domain S-box-containing protein
MPMSETESATGWAPEIAALLEAMPGAAAVIDAETATYVAINSVTVAYTGRSREDFIAKGPLGVSPDPGITPEVLQRRYRELIAIHPRGTVQEGPMGRADGTQVQGEYHRRAVRLSGRWAIVVQFIPLETLHQRPSAQAAFHRVLSLSSDAVALVDPHLMQIQDVNAAAVDLTGLSREELLERGLDTGFPGMPAPRLRELFDRLIAQSPHPRLVEAQIVRRDGSQVPVQVTQQAVDDHGRWLIVLTARDITERVEARKALERQVQELARSNEELERFAYVASHDLMEPLRMMASYAQLLDRRYRKQLDADAGDFIDFIVSGAKRMKLLLDDLLAYARAGRADEPLELVPLEQVLEDVVANLQVLIEEKHAVIEHGRLPIVKCHRSEMTRLLQNLVGNALKFGVGGRVPQVRIAASDAGTAWIFSVADNGIGIPREHFDRIFVLFQRLHAREAYAGTGIGLAICKKIVERHGGRIWVESEPGVGTTFSFTVPHDSQ